LKGSVTCAKRLLAGASERAAGGSLLFDEIGAMPSELQSRLSQVLETRQFYRIDGTTEIHSDASIINVGGVRQLGGSSTDCAGRRAAAN